MRKISSILICLLAGALSYGAEVSIGIEPDSITLNDSAVLSIIVRGAKNPPQPSNPRIPQCLTAQATTMRNADETIFRFRIYPAQIGDIKIGPIEYEVDGQISHLTANLQVLAGTEQNNPTNSLRSSMNPADTVASEFIRGNTPVASNLVTKALEKFPQDEKLLKLKKLIEEQQQQKDQQNKDQNQQDQKQDQQQDQQKQQSGQDDKKDQQQDQQKEQGQDQQQPAQPKQAGEMSKEEAQQLLDAMKQDEQDQRTNLKPFLGGPVRVEKDW